MTKTPGRGSRKLPDMSQNVTLEERYIPPSGEGVKETCFPVALGDGHSFHVRQVVYKKKTVDFALMYFYDDSEKVWEVTRTDCCHSEIHKHFFKYKSSTERSRNVIKKLYAGERYFDVVDDHFDACYDRLCENYLEDFRGWSK